MKKILSLLVLVAIFFIAFTTSVMANEIKRISINEFYQKTGLTIEDVVGDEVDEATLLGVIISEDDKCIYIEVDGDVTIFVK